MLSPEQGKDRWQRVLKEPSSPDDRNTPSTSADKDPFPEELGETVVDYRSLEVQIEDEVSCPITLELWKEALSRQQPQHIVDTTQSHPWQSAISSFRVMKRCEESAVFTTFRNGRAMMERANSGENLSEEEQKQVAAGKWAYQLIINSNLRWVMKVANSYSNRLSDNFSRETLLLVAYEGFEVAIESFDPSAGASFARYSKWWIKKYCHNYLISLGIPTSIPASTLAKFIHARAKANDGDTLSTNQPRFANKFAPKSAMMILASLYAVSFSEPAQTSSGSPIGLDQRTLWEDIIQDPSRKLFDQTSILPPEELNTLLDSELSAKEAEFIRLKFGISAKSGGECYEDEQIAALFHVSKEQVRKKIKDALARLETVLIRRGWKSEDITYDSPHY